MKSGQRGREQVCSFHVIFDHSAVLIFLMFYGLVVILFYVFLFMFENDRTHTLTHLNFGWRAPFSKIFLPFPFLPIIIPIFIREAKKTGTVLRHHLFLFYYVLCLCFYYGPRKGDFLRLVLGWLGAVFGLGFHF